MSSSARVLNFRPRRERSEPLSSEQIGAAVRLLVERGEAEGNAELFATAIRNADVLFAASSDLRDRVPSDPGLVAERSAMIYRSIQESVQEVGLFDERDYLLGEYAHLAGNALRFLGDRTEAFRWLDRAEAAYRHTVNPAPGLSIVAYTRLALRFEMGRYEDVLELLPSVVSSFEKLGMFSDVLKCRLLEAETLRNCDRLEDAYAILSVARKSEAANKDLGYLGEMLVRLGHYEALRGYAKKAIAEYRDALPLLKASNRLIGLAHAKSVLAETLRGVGDLLGALESYSAAEEDYRRLGMVTWVAHLQIMVADVLIELNRPREAEWSILQALPTIDEKKMVPEGFAAVALLRDSVKRRKTDPNALRELREHLQKQG